MPALWHNWECKICLSHESVGEFHWQSCFRGSLNHFWEIKNFHLSEGFHIKNLLMYRSKYIYVEVCTKYLCISPHRAKILAIETAIDIKDSRLILKWLGGTLGTHPHYCIPNVLANFTSIISYHPYNTILSQPIEYGIFILGGSMLMGPWLYI